MSGCWRIFLLNSLADNVTMTCNFYKCRKICSAKYFVQVFGRERIQITTEFWVIINSFRDIWNSISTIIFHTFISNKRRSNRFDNAQKIREQFSNFSFTRCKCEKRARLFAKYAYAHYPSIKDNSTLIESIMQSSRRYYILLIACL